MQTLVLNAYHQLFQNTSSAASERVVSEHFSAPLISTIPANHTKEWSSPRKCIAKPPASMVIPKSFPQHDDTANMQCRFCVSYLQDAYFNQALYQKVYDYKTLNLSVIREQDHFCLVCIDRQTYHEYQSTLHAIP
jgi:hypothetical protein